MSAMPTPPSRRMAAKFKPGTRVVATDGPALPSQRESVRYGTMQGTVVRAVEGNNAQGGHAAIEWDNGTTGRQSFGSIARVEDMPPLMRGTEVEPVECSECGHQHFSGRGYLTCPLADEGCACPMNPEV